MLVKKLCLVFLLLAAGGIGCSTPQRGTVIVPSQTTEEVYQLSIAATPLSNDSVGKEWIKQYICEGETVYSGQCWTVPSGTTKCLEIEAMITERDKCPDVGRGQLVVELRDGFIASVVIPVTENYGRYSGHTATWEVVCTVERQN